MRTRVATISVFCLLFGLPAAPARAQYGAGTSDRATGETYHVEVGGLLLEPDARHRHHQRVAARHPRIAD